MNYKILFKKEYLPLYLIILVGAFLRLQGVLTNSFAYTFDVGRDMLSLWDIVYAQNITLIGPTTGLPGVFYGPWWYYLLIPPFILFSGNPAGIAFTMSVVGIVSIVVAFILGNKIGGKFLGLSFALLISSSPVMVFMSTQIWNPNIIPFFILLLLLVLYKIFEQDKKSKLKYYFFLGLLLSFTIDLEIVFGLLLTIGIVLSVLVIVNKKIRLKEILFFILGALLISSPRIIFELRHEFLMTKSFITFLIKGGSSGSLGLVDVFLKRANLLFDYFNSTLFIENKNIGLLALFFIIFVILFLYKKSDKINRNFILTSFIVVTVFLLGTTFFSYDIWPHYLAGLPVFYILIFTICLNLFKNKLKNIFLPATIVLFIFFLNFNPISFITSINKPIFEGDAAVYRNQLAVIDYVYSQANGKDFKYVVYTPPVHDYTYRYLFKWYGPKKYHYLPSVKSNTAYFILEPDFQYPSRLTDWLKSREKDGVIIKEDKLRGGIIVQTRKVN